MIVDIDAHQGNGHGDDSRVYILDMYNPEIYPYDYRARRFIDQKVEVVSGTTTDEYLRKIDKALEDIIRLPRPFQFLQGAIAKFISVVRAPKSKEGYAAIGGGSPLRKITDEQADAIGRPSMY